MKTKLIESLKKQVLLVDDFLLPDELKTIRIDEFNSIWAVYENDEEELIGECNFKGNWSLISTIKDISEEFIKEFDLVETKQYGSRPYFCTIDYTRKGKNKNGFNPGFCANDGKQYTCSFLSSLKAEGIHLNGNPYEASKTCCSGRDCGCMGMPYNYSSKEELDEYLEVEQKEFSPETLIFVEQ